MVKAEEDLYQAQREKFMLKYNFDKEKYFIEREQRLLKEEAEMKLPDEIIERNAE